MHSTADSAQRKAPSAKHQAQSTQLIAWLATGLVIASCAEPFIPRGGVATLDDTGTGNFIAVSAGREHTCALITDGSAYCWGSNEFGQLGVATVDTTCKRDDRKIPCQLQPIAVVGGLKFQKIRAGGEHTCGLTTDYHIYCWGDNVRGALGNPSVPQSFTPVAVASTALFMDVAVGGDHSCGLRTDGVLFCWGQNDHGQLGNNSQGTSAAAPAQTATNQRFSSVAVGEHRSCARIADGTAYCWGLSFLLQGVTETTRDQTTPLRVATTPMFESLGVGTASTCGVSVDNRAYCWESNASGGIGDGTQSGSPTPRAVSTTLGFVAISSGATQTCGIADNGSAYCWGGGTLGQLGVSPSTLPSRCGTSSIPCSRVPVRVAGWRVFSQISAGLGDHVCGLTFSGNIYCWGAGAMGQRGDGRTTSGEPFPTKTRPI